MTVLNSEELVEAVANKIESYIKKSITYGKLSSFLWELENEILRNPRKHGTDQFLAQCLKEATEGVDLTTDFISGCIAAHAVLEEQYYEAKREHGIVDED